MYNEDISDGYHRVMATISDAASALTIVLSLKDLATSPLKAFHKSIKSVESAIEKASKNIFDVGKDLTVLGAAPMKIAKDTVAMATSFDDSMRKVAATVGKPYEAIDELVAKAREMGKTTRYTASESAEALNYMAMAGWNDQQMIDGLAGVMNLAAASGEDLATVSDIVTDSLSQFNLTAADSGHFADVLAKTASSANTNVSMMGASFKYVGTTAGALGYSIEDVGVALGLMANRGIKADTAGTTLRSTLTRLAKPTKQVQAAMDKLGLSLTDSHGQMKPLNQLIVEMRQSFSKLTQEEQAAAAATIGGQEAMSGLLAIVNASDEEFSTLTTAINNAGGTAQTMADTMEGGLGGAIRTLKSAFEDLTITVGDIFAAKVSEAVEMMRPVIEITQTFVKNNPELVSAFLAFGSALGTVGIAMIALSPVLNALTVLFNPLGLAIITLIGIVTAFATVWREKWDDVQIKINGFAKILQTAVGFFTNFFDNVSNKTVEGKEAIDRFKDKLTEMFGGETSQKIMDFFTTVKGYVDKFNEGIEVTGQRIYDAFGFDDSNMGLFDFLDQTWERLNAYVTTDLFNQIRTGFGNAFKINFGDEGNVMDFLGSLMAIAQPVVDIFERMLTPVIESFKKSIEQSKPLWDDILQKLGPILIDAIRVAAIAIAGFLTLILGFISGVLEAIALALPFITMMIDGVVNIISGALDIIVGILTTIWNVIKDIFTGNWAQLWSDIQNGFNQLWSGVKNLVKGIWEVIVGFIETILSAVAGFIKGVIDFFTNLYDVLVGHSIVPDMVNAIIEWFASLPGKAWDALKDLITQVVKVFTDAWSKVNEEISTWPGKLFDWGANIARSFADGFGKLGEWLKEKAVGALNAVKGILEGHSPPIEGPFKDMDKWGINVGKAWAEGVSLGIAGLQLPNLEATLTNDALHAMSAPNYGTTVPSDYSVNNSHNSSIVIENVQMSSDLDVESVAQYLGAQVALAVY